MAAPLNTLYCSSSFKSIKSVTNKRVLHLCCQNFQKKKLTKTRKVNLEQLYSETPKNTSVLKNSDVVEKEVKSNSDKSKVPVLTFQQLLQKGYLDANQSLLIRTGNAENTMQNLVSYGTISHAQFIMPEKSFLLVEFANDRIPQKIKNNASLFTETNQFPMKSRILCDARHHQQQSKKSSSFMPTPTDGNWDTKNSDSYPIMPSLEEEMRNLSISRCLDNCDLKLRFFMCMLLEDVFQPILPGSRVLPYGSCLNGFGWWSSDLDMMLCLNDEVYSGLNIKPFQDIISSRFKFVTETFINDRHLAQRTLAMLASLLELTPRVKSMTKILNARVPIIRFQHEAMNLQCDISIHCIDSIKMTEMLYLYSVCDPRVKPLMSTLKQWAISHNLTSGGEQQKLTTLGLLTMLLFYLQTRSPPVVPTLRQMQSLSKPSESFYIDDVKFGLPGNPTVLPKSKNSESMESLLHGFFLFYSQFDFGTKIISITEGQTFDKPEDSRSITVENPLSVHLNICQNVGTKALEVIKEAMKEAIWKLEELTSVTQASPDSILSSLYNRKPAASKLSVLFKSSEVNTAVCVNEGIEDDLVDSNGQNSVKSGQLEQTNSSSSSLDSNVHSNPKDITLAGVNTVESTFKDK